MKKIIVLILLFACFITQAQVKIDTSRVLQDVNGYGFQYKIVKMDSAAIFPNDTSHVKLAWNVIGFKNGLPYYKGAGTPNYTLFGSGGGTGTVTGVSTSGGSPLFTTTITPGAVPNIGFTISPALAYTLYGRNAGTTGAPDFFTPLLASNLFANQGTSSQFLRGNASGAPSWSGINVGDLPYAFPQSVVLNSNTVSLVNDSNFAATPTAPYLYGMNSDNGRLQYNRSFKSFITDFIDGDDTYFIDSNTIGNRHPTDQACNNTNSISLSYVSGLTYAYNSGPYSINCIGYTISSGATITAADGTASAGEFRFDRVYLDASGVHIRQGNNSVAGVGLAPDIDPATEISLGIIRIDEANTVPTGPASTLAFDENNPALEFSHTLLGAPTINFSYNVNAKNGDTSLRFTAAPNGSGFYLISPSALSQASFTKISFWIRNNNTFAAARNWVVTLFNGATQVAGSNQITLTTNRGYQKGLLNAWQLISFDMSAFGGSDAFDRIQIRNTGTGGTVNVQMDYFRLETGVVTGPPPPPPPQTDFATLAALKASNAHLQGVTWATTHDYRTQNKGGGAIYIWNQTSTAIANDMDVVSPNSITGASPGRWLLVILNHTLNPLQTGAYGDGIHDDLPAFKGAYNALPTFYNAFNQQSKGVIKLPVVDSQYIWSDSFLITHQIAMIADEGSMPPYSTVKILTAAGKSGIFINGEVGGRGRGVVLKNFQLWAAGSNTDTTKDGIEFNSIVDFDNLNVQGYGGNGIYGNVTVAGNANGSHIENCFTQGNGKNGYEFQGNDVNQIHFDHNQGQYNGRWNLYNNSFLGITGLSGLTAGGGARTGYASDVIVSRSGHYYQSKYPNQNKDPLTNSDIWEDLGVSTEIPASSSAWSSSPVYKSGGPIVNHGASQANVFINPYTESDGGSSLDDGSGNTIVIGGIGFGFWQNHGIHLRGREGWLDVGGAGVRVPFYNPSDAANKSYAQFSSAYGLEFINEVIADGSLSSKVQMQMSVADSSVFVFSGNIPSTPRFGWTGRPLRHPGFKIAQAQVQGLPFVGKTGLAFLSVNSASVLSGSDDIGMFAMGSTYPANEGLQFRKGFFVFNTDVTANDTLGWAANQLTNGGVSAHWDRILKGGGGGSVTPSPDLINGSATADVSADMGSHALIFSGTSGSLNGNFDNSTNTGTFAVNPTTDNTQLGWLKDDATDGSIITFGSSAIMNILGTGTFKTASLGDSSHYTNESYVSKYWVIDHLNNLPAGGGISGTMVANRIPYGVSASVLTTSSAWTFDGADKITLAGSDIRSNSGNYLRLSPTNGTIQIFNSGVTDGIDLYDGGGSTPLHLQYNQITANSPLTVNFLNSNIHTTGSGGSTELVATDGAGNNTTISPHAQGLIKYRLKKLGWTFNSIDKDGNQITVDELKARETIEQLSKEVEELKMQVAQLMGKNYQKKKPVKIIYKKIVK